MNHNLLDLVFFAELQAKVAAVTAENLAQLPPQPPIPLHAVIVGDTPPALQALFFVIHDLKSQVNQEMETLLTSVAEISFPEFEAKTGDAATKRDKCESYSNLFWQTLFAEFTDLPAGQVVIGPKFEVYVLPEKDTADGFFMSCIKTLKTAPQTERKFVP